MSNTNTQFQIAFIKQVFSITQQTLLYQKKYILSKKSIIYFMRCYEKRTFIQSLVPLYQKQTRSRVFCLNCVMQDICCRVRTAGRETHDDDHCLLFLRADSCTSSPPSITSHCAILPTITAHWSSIVHRSGLDHRSIIVSTSNIHL